MAEVKVLIEGYFINDPPSGKACSTVSLVKDGNIRMVVDPGTSKNQETIIEALKKEGLTIKDINWVCLTHSHIDHYRNIGMFPNAKTLEYWGIWEGDKEAVNWKEQFTKDIKIIKTPGHDKTSITLLVKTNKGIVAICGDVFWKENFPEEDPYADDPEKLKESKKKVLELADWIVPGHANIYEVRK